MRLYPKKLRNIKDLEREKKLLQKESKRMEEEGFLSVESLLNKRSGKEKENASSVFDFLPTSNPLVAILVKLVKQKVFNKDNKSKAADNTACDTGKKSRNNPVKSLAVEFIGGYLKWKAIELSYKGIRQLIKKRKEQNPAD